MRVINIYKCFTMLTYLLFSNAKLILYALHISNNTILFGYLNIDGKMKDVISYPFTNYFSFMKEKMRNNNVIQIVNFATWSRSVSNVFEEFTLDHTYTDDSTSICKLYSIKPIIWDHLLVVCVIAINKSKPDINSRRSW
jgi:hypothetical protein